MKLSVKSSLNPCRIHLFLPKIHKSCPTCLLIKMPRRDSISWKA